jgi:hypothetical protein
LKKSGNTTININQYSVNVDKEENQKGQFGDIEVVALSLFDRLSLFVPEREVFTLFKLIIIQALRKREGSNNKVAKTLQMQRTYISRLINELKREPYYEKLMEAIALAQKEDGTYELSEDEAKRLVKPTEG